MKQIYHPYWNWEDYKAGLYQNFEDNYDEQETYRLATKARDLLADSILFKDTALTVIAEWKIAAEVNLSNIARNRQAWIGQASCCYVFGIPEFITKYGWRMLTPEQQLAANKVADEVILQWEMLQKVEVYAKKLLEY
jgi:hypothetical protein